MEFREKQSIYLQIAEQVCERILLKKWPLEEKIPSIRDTAVELQVNPNTVQRSFDFLQQKDIIINQRGVGYFVAADAIEKITELRKEQFIQDELPIFFRNMYLLKMDFKEVQQLYNKFKKDNF